MTLKTFMTPIWREAVAPRVTKLSGGMCILKCGNAQEPDFVCQLEKLGM